MRPILKVDGASARYGRKRALSEVSFELNPGSACVLLGENGAGKSTLLRTILGLEKLRSGSIQVEGIPVRRRASGVLQQVGYVPDVPDVSPWMTLADYFHFLRPQLVHWSDQRAQELTELLEVPIHRPFRQLSRGQATKAMLAGALAHQPALLLMDEPFGPLDPGSRDSVLRGVLDGLTDAGCAALIATHDVHMAARIADSIILLQQGRVQASGPLEVVLGTHSESNQIPRRLKALFTSQDERPRSCA